MPRIRMVDLFCGAGGLTHGFAQEGVEVVAGIDLDPACKFPYERNNKASFIQRDISQINGGDLQKLFGRNAIRVLAGCAPCQPFSKYTQGKPRDSKWGLLYEFARLIDESRPEVITMENVPELTRHRVFSDFMHRLKEHGYHVTYRVVDCREYGVPQFRKRLVLLASQLGPINLIPGHLSPSKFLTVRKTIGRLPALAAGDSHLKDRLHTSSTLSPLNLQRIQASKPGGSWEDWRPSLVAECHKKIIGSTYKSVYGRMEWDKPAPTITTQCFGFGNGRFGHPEQDRAISLREAAILQSFPPKYRFVGKAEKLHISVIGRLIGNAVPVALGRAIAKSITLHVGSAG